jgi:hypothetical protein
MCIGKVGHWKQACGSPLPKVNVSEKHECQTFFPHHDVHVLGATIILVYPWREPFGADAHDSGNKEAPQAQRCPYADGGMGSPVPPSGPQFPQQQILLHSLSCISIFIPIPVSLRWVMSSLLLVRKLRGSDLHGCSREGFEECEQV